MICEQCGKLVPTNSESGRVSKWDTIKAQDQGWFFQRDGTTWCPKHIPDWVPEWRKKQADKAKQREWLLELVGRYGRDDETIVKALYANATKVTDALGRSAMRKLLVEALSEMEADLPPTGTVDEDSLIARIRVELGHGPRPGGR